MLTRLHISIILILALIVWGVSLLILGIPISWEYAKPYTVTLTILTGVVVAFERWWWKASIFKGWLVNRPVIQGTWKVILQSNYVDPQTQKRIEPIYCVMVIRQTLATLSMRLFTSESQSVLVANKIKLQNDGVFEVFGVYQNEPDIHLRGDRSEIHFGALKLRINGEPPKSMNGHYWTDRETKGSLELEERREVLASSYDEGATLYQLQTTR